MKNKSRNKGPFRALKNIPHGDSERQSDFTSRDEAAILAGKAIDKEYERLKKNGKIKE